MSFWRPFRIALFAMPPSSRFSRRGPGPANPESVRPVGSPNGSAPVDRVGLGLGIAAIAAVFFGVGGVVAADVFDRVDPIAASQYRLVGSAAIVLPVGLARRSLEFRAGGWPMLMLGAVLVVVTSSFYVAIDEIGVGPTVTIQFTAPLAVMAWTRFVRRDHVPSAVWGAGALALVGVALVAGAVDGLRPSLLGLGAAAMALMGLAAYVILTDILTTRLKPESVVLTSVVVAGAIWLVVRPPMLYPPEFGAAAAGQLAWLIVMATILPFFLETVALGLAPMSLVAVVATLEPVVATTAAWVFLDQRLTAAQTLGSGLILLGVVIARLSARST